MNRRHMLKQMGLALAASGLAVPAWILDPLKGRSMVTVPGVPHILGYAEWMKWEAVAFSYATHRFPLKIEVAREIHGPWVEWEPYMGDAPRYCRAVG